VSDSRRLVAKLVAGSNVLRDAGVNMYEYTEQLTYLLFLKMAEERATRRLNPERVVPDEFAWHRLLGLSGEALEDTYNHVLRGLASQPGVLGAVYRGAQNKISNPSHLKTLIVDYIDKENWSAAGADVNGDAYEELLERSAGDTKSTAGQYFTPLQGARRTERVRAVEVVRLRRAGCPRQGESRHHLVAGRVPRRRREPPRA
jgi:type I restriction enzyme M protein